MKSRKLNPVNGSAVTLSATVQFTVALNHCTAGLVQRCNGDRRHRVALVSLH